MLKPDRIFLRILFIIGLLGCNPRKENLDNPDSEKKTILFHKFLKKFPILKFPIDLDERGFVSFSSHYPEIENLKTDSIFRPKILSKDDRAWSGVGILPDTSKYYALLFFLPADEVLPYLITYSKTGKKIDEIELCTGECGGGPDMICGTHYGFIHADMSFFCADTMDHWRADSLYRPIPGTRELYITSFKGKVDPDGKIMVEKDRREDLAVSINGLEKKVQQLDLEYIVWGCACPNWITSSDRKSYEKKDLLSHCIYLEAADTAIKIPGNFDAFNQKVSLTGQFYESMGYPKGWRKTEEPAEKAKVFRYTKMEIHPIRH